MAQILLVNYNSRSAVLKKRSGKWLLVNKSPSACLPACHSVCMHVCMYSMFVAYKALQGSGKARTIGMSFHKENIPLANQVCNKPSRQVKMDLNRNLDHYSEIFNNVIFITTVVHSCLL